jgi:HD-GYP domain-containing protein (c-di-GMP phosphodiesterase class II)
MSLEISGTGFGSAAQRQPYARLPHFNLTEDRISILPELPDHLSARADPGVRFSRAVRQILHERFQDLFLQLTPRMKAKDAQLYAHAQRVLTLTLRLLRILDLSEHEAVSIALAAFFHDIGKLSIEDAILKKASVLTPDEYGLMQQHAAFAVDLLSPYLSSQFSTLSYVYHHHERWDGQGYPCGLEGEAIPLGARIIAITDAFDAMTSERAYQAQRTPNEALEELVRCAGTQFDPHLVRLFLIAR